MLREIYQWFFPPVRQPTSTIITWLTDDKIIFKKMDSYFLSTGEIFIISFIIDKKVVKITNAPHRLDDGVQKIQVWFDGVLISTSFNYKELSLITHFAWERYNKIKKIQNILCQQRIDEILKTFEQV